MGEVQSLTVAMTRSSVRHRTTGHAAEMSFFSMLALVPATVAIGGAMHVVARIAGEQTEVKEQQAAVSSIRLILGSGLGEQVIVPFVRAQLAQPHGGLAIGSLLVTWWLLSHLFHSTSHALDVVYEVRDLRRSPVRRAIALTYALGAAIAITMTLAVMSAVPLGVTEGPRAPVALSAAQLVWTVARWPLLVVVLVLALTALYRFSPDVRHTFRQCLPGAVLGVTLWAGLIVGFRYYLALGFGAPTGVLSDDPSIVLIGRAVGAVVATAFLFYFASSAVLLGAELNAQLLRRSRERRIVAEVGAAASLVPGAPEPAAVGGASVLARLRSFVPSGGRAADGASVVGRSVDGRSVDGRWVNGRSVNGRWVNGRSVNGRSGSVPVPSPGRRVRVVPTRPGRADEPSGPAEGSVRV